MAQRTWPESSALSRPPQAGFDGVSYPRCALAANCGSQSRAPHRAPHHAEADQRRTPRPAGRSGRPAAARRSAALRRPSSPVRRSPPRNPRSWPTAVTAPHGSANRRPARRSRCPPRSTRRVVPPQQRIGEVRHHQLPGRRKHRHRLVHRVDHRLAQFQVGPEAAGPAHLGRDILEQQRQRAVGMRPRDHPVGLPARQVPGLLVEARRGLLFQLDDLSAASSDSPSVRGSSGGRASGPARGTAWGATTRKSAGSPVRSSSAGLNSTSCALPVEDRQADRQMGEGLGQRLREIAQLHSRPAPAVDRRAHRSSGRRPPAGHATSNQCAARRRAPADVRPPA